MLDCGCGIGGPLCVTARSNPPHLVPRASRLALLRPPVPPTRANLCHSRNIGKFTGSSVIGVTLNQYQVDRGNALCKKAGLDKCKLVKVRPPSPAIHRSIYSSLQLPAAHQLSAEHAAAAASAS